MLPLKFRRTLQQEADRWRAEGFIDSDFHAKLADRYQFDKLEREASSTFVSAIIGLGSVLVGLGILTFVALNWQYLDKPLRIVILVGGLLAANIGGFYLWQRAESRRFGQGLLLLGAIIFGADLTLIAQLFHLDVALFALLMGWALGVLVMAYALGMTSLGVVAIALMGCGYWSAAFSGAEVVNAPVWARLLYQQMPLLSISLFVPLAYRCRSPVIFGLGTLAWLSSFQFANTSYTFGLSNTGVDRIGVVLACGLPPLLLWATGRVLEYSRAPEQFPRRDYRLSSARFAQRLAVISSGLTVFLLSIDGFTFGVLRLAAVDDRKYVNIVSIDRVLLTILTIGLWLLLWRRVGRWRLNDGLMLGLGLGTIGLLTLATGLPATSFGFWLPKLFSLVLTAITLVCIRHSLQTGDRGAFYFGWLLLSIRILIWFALTEVDLSLKSLLFIISGIVTIALGVWFERRLRLFN